MTNNPNNQPQQSQPTADKPKTVYVVHVDGTVEFIR